MLRKPIAAALLSTLALSAHAAIGAGSIAFTSFNADEDGFSIVALADIAPDTTIYFQDNEWNGSAIGAGGAFNTGEGKQTWQSGAATVLAGTVIRFNNVDSASLHGVSVGTHTLSGDTGINATNETLYAYLGSAIDTPTVFLAAISNGNFGSNGKLDNTGLSVGTNAIALPASSDWHQYNGLRSGKASFAQYLPLVTDLSQWTGHDGAVNGDFSAQIPNTTAFTLAPIPEPSTWALMAAGLALVTGLSRRRR
ncbi:MAG: hypothetical protein AMXMBFR6_14780 [Betaproteobacteria bacterium]|nr:hypothetical protein [Rhodocyclaceae bacterium]